jgi:hypothetical protein
VSDASAAVASARLRRGEWLGLGALAAIVMGLAWLDPWLCDDAFISFRYAENLVAGRGLVFNAGEYVEGYSNFLWVVLLALADGVGIDMIAAAQWLGVLCLGGTVIAAGWAGRRLAPNPGPVPLLAALGVFCHHHLLDFATCGLETLGFVLLVTLTIGVLAGAERPRSFALASLLSVLAALTRPDGALLGMVAGGHAVLHGVRRRQLAPVLAFAAPGFLLFVPFLAWRVLYYGDLLPNTFYAKSAHDPYPGQGWFYVRTFLCSYWVLWPAVLALPLLLLRGTAALRLLAAMVVTYLAFVVWVGGDFMFARFCLPVVPLLYLVLEVVVVRCCPARAQRWAWLLVIAGTCLWLPRADMQVTGQGVHGVADEHAQYPAERVDRIRATGRRLRELCGGVPLRVAFSGTQAMLVFDAKVPYALEAVTGLTDRWLARQPVGERGHVGHEKGIFRSWEATEYALRQQGVHLFLFDWPDKTRRWPFLRVEVDGVLMTMVRWERAVLQTLLDRPGVVATDFDAYLDGYLRDLDGKDPQQVREDLAVFELVHFRWNDDAARRQVLLGWLAKPR